MKTLTTEAMITSLLAERRAIDATLATLLKLQEARGGKRGRPPLWLTEANKIANDKPRKDGAP